MFFYLLAYPLHRIFNGFFADTEFFGNFAVSFFQKIFVKDFIFKVGEIFSQVPEKSLQIDT